MLVLAIPCILGFNVLAGFEPLGAGTNIMDLEDFIISNNLLPLGSLCYVLFCTYNKKGWGWSNFIKEVNIGKKGITFPACFKIYVKYMNKKAIIKIPKRT